MDRKNTKKNSSGRPVTDGRRSGSAQNRSTAQKAGPAKRQETKRMRPLILILLAFSLLMLGLLVWLVIFLSQRVAPKQKPVTGLNIQQYLSDYWDWYEYKGWDEKTGVLELTAPINSQADISLAQAQKYALLDGVRYDELAESDVENLKKMLYGQNGDGAVGTACGIDVKNIVLSRMSSDGEIVYTVDLNGVQWYCWAEP